MARKHSFSSDFKHRAVKMAEEEGNTIAHVARELGINENTLSGWVQKHRKNPDETFPGSGKLNPEDAKLRKLERENRELKEEIEILKKAAAYFAKNQR